MQDARSLDYSSSEGQGSMPARVNCANARTSPASCAHRTFCTSSGRTRARELSKLLKEG